MKLAVAVVLIVGPLIVAVDSKPSDEQCIAQVCSQVARRTITDNELNTVMAEVLNIGAQSVLQVNDHLLYKTVVVKATGEPVATCLLGTVIVN